MTTLVYGVSSLLYEILYFSYFAFDSVYERLLDSAGLVGPHTFSMFHHREIVQSTNCGETKKIAHTPRDSQSQKAMEPSKGKHQAGKLQFLESLITIYKHLKRDQ